MTATLVGFKVGHSNKSGKDFCMLHVVIPGTSRDELSGQVGGRVETLFCPPDQVHSFLREHIGCELELEYDVSGGKAYLVHVEVLPPAKGKEKVS